MPFTLNWSRLFLSHLRNENAIVHDISNDEIETDGKIYGYKIGIGTGSSSFNREAFELATKDSDLDATLNAIDESNPNEVFYNYDAVFNKGSQIVFREYGVYAMVKDLSDNDKQILIRRDLLPTPFTTEPNEDFRILYKASSSNLV
jgi:hypothetical protein